MDERQAADLRHARGRQHFCDAWFDRGGNDLRLGRAVVRWRRRRRGRDGRPKPNRGYGVRHRRLRRCCARWRPGCGAHGLELDNLRGRPAAEVVVAISEYLAGDAEGLDREFLQTALSEALIEAASLGDEFGYDNFAAGLERFLAENGPDGLVELFLEHFVFDTLWGRVEQHAVDKSPDAASLESLMTAMQGECVAQVREQMDASRAAGSFSNVDWFGRAGLDLAMRIVVDLEARLSALRET